MPAQTLYNLSTGALVDLVADLPEAVRAASTPAGHAWIDGRHDHRNRRVVFGPDDYGEAIVPRVEAYQPPPPAATELVAWSWDAAAELWVAQPTTAALALQTRQQRDARLQACDWIVARAQELGEPIPAAWRAYRQALRDLPEQAGFPTTITWPSQPNE